MLQLVLTNELYFLFSIFLLFFFCIHYGIYNKNSLYQLQNQMFTSSSILIIYYIILLFIGIRFVEYSFFNIVLIDSYSLILQIMVAILTLAILVMSRAFIRVERMNYFEMYLLILIAVLGLLFLVELIDLLGIYLSIELVSLSFYILTAFSKHNVYATEAALKYFILGSISSNFILFGFSYMYVVTGMTNMLEINKLIVYYIVGMVDKVYLFHSNILISSCIFSLFFIFLGLLFKIYAAPFHLWIPDIYNHAPLLITAFFSIIPLIPFINVILRFSFYFNVLGSMLSYFFLLFAFCSIIFGALGALFQSKIKRLLAYSAVTHVGYFLLFIYLLLKMNELNIYIVQLLFTYIFLYLVTNVGIFGILTTTYSYLLSNYTNELFHFSKLYKTNWLISFIFAVFFFSVSGIPPLSGFAGKLFLFSSVLSSGDKIFLFFVLMIYATISSFYYVRIIKILYYNEYNEWHFFPVIRYSSSVLIALVFLFVIHFFFFSEYVNIITLYLSLVLLQ